ncbi:MAG: T9SS type A sorting domain-containing protein [Ignavibacteria bacterium]|nr:T9SS type A sorting domain-containing protein [Ignavibacteria bacterium]
MQNINPYNGGGRLVKLLGNDTILFSIEERHSNLPYYDAIRKSTNGGNSWITTYQYAPYLYVNTLCFIDNNTGWLCCRQDFNICIMSTINGGSNWYGINHPQGGDSNSYNSLFFTSTSDGWILIMNSYSGDIRNKIAKTTNGGFNWSLYTLPAIFWNVKFINSSTGFICGTGLMKSTNGGINWVQKFYEPDLKKLFFVNDLVGFCFGDSGNVWKTYNMGENWSKIASFGKKLTSGYFVNENTGWIVGADGLILKTTNGGVGVSEISSQMPDDFSLFQNYPNPFNPSTKINYEIKQSGFVSLKIFDLLGKEVAMLVNEKQTAGSYAVDFNSPEYNLPSGIYFYTLNAGEFKETRKMVLVK